MASCSSNNIMYVYILYVIVIVPLVCDMAQTQHEAEDAKRPRASAVFEAILHTKRTIAHMKLLCSFRSPPAFDDVRR